MPHILGHIEEEEFAPINFPVEETEGFAPIDFGVGQGRTEQKFVPENNSIVTMPATSSTSFNSRESKELIEGQEGLFGNTPTVDLFELLGAPGGVIDTFIISDIKKLPGGIIRDFVETLTGGLRERVVLALEEQPTVTFRGKELEPFPDPLLDVYIKKNPELAQRFSEKMLDLQKANEDFLIRHDLLFGPNDQPTILGNALSQFGTSVSMIGAAIFLRDPRLPALMFGLIQQVAGFQEAEEAGKDPVEAAAIGNVQGVIEAGISLIGIGRLTRIITSKSTSIASKIIASMAVEGIEEGVTEALIIAVQNATGVKDMTLREALVQVFQAVFYGSLLGAGTTGTITTTQAIVQRIAGDSISQQDTEKIVRVMDDVANDEAVEITEQDIDDANTELEIGRDIASDQTVTKAAKTTAKQQERVIEILTAINEGKDFDIQAVLDKAFPEAKIQRLKTIFDTTKRADIRAVTKQAIRQEVIGLQAEIQIAEQQGNEEEAARLSERIEQIRQAALTQAAFPDMGIFEAVEELEAEGIFPRADEQFEKAIVEIGRVLQRRETRDLQDALTEIVDSLTKKQGKVPAIVTGDPAIRLQRKVREANTIASAERVRRDILSLARKSAFKQFIAKRRVAIDKAIKDNVEKPRGKLDADSQNILDSLNTMRKGMDSARTAKGLPPVKQQTDEQKKQAIATRDKQTADFNIKQSRRIEDEMGQGIPAEGVVLQVRYLDILNEKSKVIPQTLAVFEDDLNAFIETGKGIATAADVKNQEILDSTKTQIRSGPVKTTRSDITNKTIVAWDQVFDWAVTTFQTLVDALQLSGTPFDFFNPEVAFRAERIEREREVATLRDEVSEGDGKKYRKELESDDLVIDVPLKGHAKQFDGTKPKRIRMTRGQLITAWMYLREPSLRKQMQDPNGDMAWTDKLVAMIEQRMTRQDIEYALGMFEIYSRSYDRFSEVNRRMYNRDLTRVEFYTHIAREGKEGIDASTHNETMFIDLIAPKDRGGSEIFPQQPREGIERVENASSEIKIGNVLDMYKGYTWDVEHFIAFGEQIRLVDQLLKDKEFKRDIEDILTPGGFLNFKAHIKIVARTNVGSRKTGALWQLFESLRQKAFKSTLGLNEKIGLGQTATVMAWAPLMPKSEFGFGVQDYSLNPKKANETLDKHPTFRDRELNFSPEFEQLDAIGTVFKFTSISIRKGDGWAVRSGAWAYFLHLTKNGMSEADALNKAARFAEASQQSTLPSQKSLAQKSDDPLVRTMMMYRSSLVSMFNVSMQSVIEYRQADTSTSEKKATARKKLYEVLVTQNFIIPGLYATLTGKPLTQTILVGSSAAIPGFSEMFEVIIGVVMNIFADEDDRIYFGGPLLVPAGEALKEIEMAIDNMGDFIDDVVRNGLKDAMDEVTMGTFVESIQGIIDVTTGFPMTNAMNKYEAAMKFFETDDPIDAALQMLGFKEEARKRTIERLDAVTGGESSADSDRVLTQGAF